MSTRRLVVLGSAVLTFVACHDPLPPDDAAEVHVHEACSHEVRPDRVEPPLVEHPAIAEVSVADRDRPTRALALGDPTLPVEARLLVLAADGNEPELGAIQSVLRHRGVPFDVFVASAEPPLLASRLRTAAGGGAYQGTILTSNALAVGGSSQLSASEWTVLADYEQAFAVRRAVLASTADPALGWGSATTQSTSAAPLDVTCSPAGRAVFRDVNCDLPQPIAGGTVYLAAPASPSLTPLLRDAAGHALAALHTGGDGRESLLLLFRQDAGRTHSQQFLHGVVNWVTAGTWLGERRLDLGLQIDDIFLASNLYTGGTYRLTAADLAAVLDWVEWRRAQPSTPDFQLTMAYNGLRATAGDPLTEEARATSDEWDWVTHTYDHHHLDAADYAFALTELTRNLEVADDLPLLRFDPTSFVPPNISGLVNPEVMQAAVDVGIRYAVSDTSQPGCDNPSPNLAFYNQLQPSMLLVPRRPGGIPYHVSTPAEWMAYHDDREGGSFTYAHIVDDKADTLFTYVMRAEADPWMYHQANLRAYDGQTTLLADVIDEVVDRVQQRLRVPMRTPDLRESGERFARRINFEGAGVRATLHRGRALVIDAGRAVTFPVTGVRPQDGESYGGDVITLVTVTPGTSACVPLDAAGAGCAPSPGRTGGAGPVAPIPTGYCDGTGTGGLVLLPPPPPPTTTTTTVGVPRQASWWYWDDGGDLGTSWRTQTTGGAGWERGAGVLGYGESYVDTTVSYGASSSNKHPTTYFTTTFDVTDAAAVTSMVANVLYDDGFVVYLNGAEVARASMPGGAVTAATRALGHDSGAGYERFDYSAARGLLRDGTNVLAVEVHQVAGSSSDLVFDLELVLVGGGGGGGGATAGFPAGSTWRWYYAAASPPAAWSSLGHDDGSWPTGAGPLGYGEPYIATPLPFADPGDKPISAYFRRTFEVDDPSAITRITGTMRYDDGAVVWINGVEAGRAFMPVTVSPTTRGHDHEAVGYETFDWSARRASLVTGTNVIAVEVHQTGPASSDLVFDLALDLQ